MRRFHTYRKKSALVIAVEQAQLATEAVTRWWLRPFRFVAKKMKGSARLLTRCVVYAGLSMLALSLVAMIGAMLFLTDGRVQGFLVDTVRAQTGGDLAVGATDFGLFRGVEFKDLTFTPAGENTPLLRLDGLAVKYKLWKILYGRVQVDAVSLNRPTVQLREKSGVWNFQSIISHREKEFPTVPETPEPAPATPLKLSKILPVNPRNVFMPFSIALKGIGITELDVGVEKLDGDTTRERLRIRSAGVDVGLEWKHRQSRVVAELGAIGETPMVFQRSVVDEKGQISDTSATLDGKFRIELKNFFDLTLLVDVNSLVGDQDGQSTPELSGAVDVALSVQEDLSGLKVERGNVTSGKFLKSSLVGDLAFPNDDFSAVRVSLKEDLSVSLDELGVMAKKVMPDLVTSGSIRVDGLRADGVLELGAPKGSGDAAQVVTLPHVSGAINLENIEMSYEPAGIILLPTSGIIGLAAGPDVTGKGSQIEATSNINVMGLHLRQKTKKGEVSVAVDNLFTGLTARVMYPELSLPVFKLNLEAEHVIAGGGGLNAVDAPLYVSINADAQNKLKRAGFNAAFELKDLLDAAVMVDCQDDCSKVRTSAKVRVNELGSLYSVALPMLLKSGSDLVPRSMTGGIDFQASGRGVIPKPMTSTLAEILKGGDVSFDTEVTLSDFNAQIPRDNISVENYEARLRIDGSLKQQRVQLQQTLQKAGITLPQTKRGEPLRTAVVERLSWETELRNRVNGAMNPHAPLSSMISELNTKVFIGRTTLGGILPRPINGFEFSTNARLNQAKRLFLNQLSLVLPDMGTTAAVSGELGLDDHIAPADFKAKLSLTTNPGTEDAVPGGIRMSGRVGVTAAVESYDMDTVKINAGLDFGHYSIKIPAADEKLPPRLVVENINGQLPIERTVSLNALRKTQIKADVTDQRQPETLADATSDFFARNDEDVMNSSNAMAIMDFGSVRPTFAQRKPISIERIEVANVELSKMEFDLEVRQEWISLNQFVIGFLGGKIQGSTHLVFDDAPRAVKSAIHMTKLDTHKLVEKFPHLLRKASAGAFGGNPFIDAVMHLSYDFKSNDMAGGLEIASIGKEQLRMILYYIDPQEENQTIGDIRRALTFGEVRQVSVPIKNGQIGLDVDVRVLSAPIPVPKLSRFPLSQLVQNMSEKSNAETPVPSQVQSEEAEKADAT